MSMGISLASPPSLTHGCAATTPKKKTLRRRYKKMKTKWLEKNVLT